MSNTQILYANEKGWVHPYTDIPNSEEGAFHIWRTLARTYLEEELTMENLSQVSDLVYAAEIVPFSIRLVLGSTMDHALVMKDNLGTFINALMVFNSVYPSPNLKSQIRALEAIERRDGVLAVCWNQNTAVANQWEIKKTNKKPQKWNIKRDLGYFDVFQGVRLDGKRPDEANA